MNVFLILQMLFDAVLLFGVLFLFHFSVNQTQKKKEEWDILKSVQTQEINENLQELLMTLKQLGKEVSENIQEEIREAEEKTEIFKKVVSKLQKDLLKATKLAEEIEIEKIHLENKTKAIETAKRNTPPMISGISRPVLGLGQEIEHSAKKTKGLNLDKTEANLTFSSGMVREVYRLLDEKMGMNEIAQRTKLSRAEIQLILNLRGNGFSTPN